MKLFTMCYLLAKEKLVFSSRVSLDILSLLREVLCSAIDDQHKMNLKILENFCLIFLCLEIFVFIFCLYIMVCFFCGVYMSVYVYFFPVGFILFVCFLKKREERDR